MPTVEELAARVAALEARTATSESVLAIQTLKARYGEVVDSRFSGGSVVDETEVRRLAEEATNLFTEDATWDGGPGLGLVRGRAAIADRLARPTLVFARHLFVRPRIAVEGDRARGRWDLLCPCTTEDGVPRWMCGYEDDEYRRDGATWLHESMRLTTVFVAPVADGWTRIFT